MVPDKYVMRRYIGMKLMEPVRRVLANPWS
jgi:hypothetical protein